MTKARQHIKPFLVYAVKSAVIYLAAGAGAGLLFLIVITAIARPVMLAGCTAVGIVIGVLISSFYWLSR